MRTEVCAEVCAAGTIGIGAVSPAPLESLLCARTVAHTVCGCATALSDCCI